MPQRLMQLKGRKKKHNLATLNRKYTTKWMAWFGSNVMGSLGRAKRVFEDRVLEYALSR